MSEVKKSILYFADPMCSWCWGFAPVVEEIIQSFAERLPLLLVLGGLRPGTNDPVTNQFREEILHHWHEVHRRTNQPFSFKGAMPDGFVYDTEPACRAVVTVGELMPHAVLGYFKTIQQAFYVDQLDVTNEDVLCELAVQFNLSEVEFKKQLRSASLKEKTIDHFNTAQQFSVRGFPTLVLQKIEKNKKDFQLLSHGFQSYESIKFDIDVWLKQ